MSVTKLQIRQELARLLAGTNLVTGITTSAGAATGLTMIDTQYKSSLLQSGNFVGSHIYMNNGAHAGDWRRVASYDPATGTFTVDRAWQVAYTGLGVTTDATAKTLTDTRRNWSTNSLVGLVITCNTRTLTVTSNTATVATGSAGWSADPGDGYSYAIPAYAVPADTSYEILLTMNFTQMNEVIERAMRKMLYLMPALPSLLSDSDMEDSGVDSWLAGTGATVSKITVSYFRGSQALEVGADGTGNRYAYQNFNVTPGKDYYIWCVCRSPVITYEMKLVVYDNTNAAEIDSKTTIHAAWQGLSIAFTPPSGCKQVQIRLQTVTLSVSTYWDQVQLLSKDTIRYVLPSWVTEIWQVGRPVFQYEGADSVTDAWAVDTVAPRRWAHIRIYKEGPRVYVTPDPPFSNEAPVYIECLRPYAALTGDSSTTDADLDWVVSKAYYEAKRILAKSQIPADEREEFKKELDEAKMEAAQKDALFMPKIDYPWAPFGDELWAPAEVR